MGRPGRLLAAVLLLTAGGFAAQFHVPADDPVYIFLERLDARGLLPDYLDNDRWLTREEVAGQLRRLDASRDVLTRGERELLDRYLTDYRQELSGGRHPDLGSESSFYSPLASWRSLGGGLRHLSSYDPAREEHHLLVYQDASSLLWFDLHEMGRIEFRDGIGRFLTLNSFRIGLQLGPRLSLYGDAYIYDQQVRDGYDEPADEYKGGQYGVANRGLGYRSAAFEYSDAYVAYQTTVGEFALGVEPLVWGPGRYSLILSDNVDPFACLSWKKTIGKSRFSFFHGYINPPDEGDTTATGEKIFNQKYLAAHRWEIPLTPRFKCAFTEVLVYGGRDPEAVFFLPLIFYWSAHHAVARGSDDNILWLIEGEWRALPAVNLYGSLLIDEFASIDIFERSWRNKWGVQAGAFWAPRLADGSAASTDLRVEFVAVHPWVYTHCVPEYSSYTHNGRVIGFPYGPNSQLLLLENRWALGARQRIALTVQQIKHGTNPLEPGDAGYYPLGDDANQDYDDRDPALDDDTGWLIGDVTVTRECSLAWSCRLTDVVTVTASLGYRSVDDQGALYSSFQVACDY